MKPRTDWRCARKAPLAAALILAGLVCDDAGAAALPALDAAMPATRTPGAGVAALMQALHGAAGPRRRGAVPNATGTVRSVTSCADDFSAGTLRDVINLANSGDTIELGALTCSTITLGRGAIEVDPDELIIHGAGASKIAIDGGNRDRVFVHVGYTSLTLSGVTVRNGKNSLLGYKVAGGACILGYSKLVLDHSTVSGCSAIGEGAYGGAILARSVYMYTSTLSDNIARGSPLATLTAAYGGGAFAYQGFAALYDSTVSGNRATIDPANAHGSYDTGGGVFADSGGYLVRSTFEGNYTDGSGGGFAGHGDLTVTNATLSGNTAKRGGALFTNGKIALSIASSTIARNTAQTGGGIFVAGVPRQVTLQSSLVADNATATADIGAQNAFAIGGANNLVTTIADGVSVPAGTLHSDPGLQPLAANGGPTRTHALTASSPAIDAGNNAGNLSTDQRGAGFPRAQGRAPDIGAFEAAPGAVVSIAPAPAASPTALAMLTALLAWFGGHRSMRRRGLFTPRSPPDRHPSQM